MKKIISLFICMAVVCGAVPCVFAYEFPSEFWGLKSEYERAMNNGDNWNVACYGMRILSLLLTEPTNADTKNTIVNTFEQTGNAYAACGDYDSAADVFDAQYNYVCRFGDEYHDYKITSDAKRRQFVSQSELYTDNGPSVYFGAKNEKRSGVLFGFCSNAETRTKADNASMVLMYQEIKDSLSGYNKGVMRDADSKNLAVEFALNCPKEGDDIRRIKSFDDNLRDISDMFSQYSDTPVYLRFAAEFDIWENKAEADEFKAAFRYVSDFFHNRNSNVAVVWSPNQVSNWYINTDDYYPGDEYVDWVGISSYAHKYFRGDKTQPWNSQIAFKAGDSSEPVRAIQKIVETYGNRKPIMLSEFGSGHTLVKTGESMSDFALTRLKQYLGYIPMVYPQVKLMAYFDWYVDSPDEKYDYRLSENSEMQNEFLNMTKGSRFIQGSYNGETDMNYRRFEGGETVESIFPVACYARKFGAEPKSAVYFIDGEYVGQSSDIPYMEYIDASDFGGGRHTLKAITLFSDGETLTKEVPIYIREPYDDITVRISGERIRFDREPILYNDRTMVPMRKIFEELGADVSWNDSEQTATGKKGDRTVKVTVNSKTMYVNNKKITLDTAPIVVSARTLVPVRAVAEGLGCDVDWTERTSTVDIEPKEFKWSAWTDELPNDVDDDLYYIEKRDEYRYRTCRREYKTSEDGVYLGHWPIKEEKIYGEWSDWQRERVSESSSREVETKTEYEPKRYKFAHYCTGAIDDVNNRYMTADYKFHDQCIRHDIGWFDYMLPAAPDGQGGYVTYNSDGELNRCSNGCYRYYVMDESGGEYTMYRYRTIGWLYYYQWWGDWTDWSDWDTDDPNDFDIDDDTRIDVERRTVVRYKEKG